MSRIGTAFRMGTRQFRRTPLLLALLVVGPAYVIYLFTLVAPAGPALLHLGGDTVATTLPKAFPAFTTPMTAALISGIAGLFLMRTAATTDSRLAIAGYRAYQIVLARLGLLVGIAVVATAVSVGVMLTSFTPDRLGWFAVGTALTALIYGMVGLLIGLLIDRLLGVYIVLFGSMIDLFIFQNPLATDTPSAARLLPGHYPLRLAMDAGFTGQIATQDFVGALIYLVVLTGFAIIAFYRETQVA